MGLLSYLKEFPHPQESEELGFVILNPEPSTLSTYSMVEPFIMSKLASSMKNFVP